MLACINYVQFPTAINKSSCLDLPLCNTLATPEAVCRSTSLSCHLQPLANKVFAGHLAWNDFSHLQSICIGAFLHQVSDRDSIAKSLRSPDGCNLVQIHAIWPSGSEQQDPSFGLFSWSVSPEKAKGPSRYELLLYNNNV